MSSDVAPPAEGTVHPTDARNARAEEARPAGTTADTGRKTAPVDTVEQPDPAPPTGTPVHASDPTSNGGPSVPGSHAAATGDVPAAGPAPIAGPAPAAGDPTGVVTADPARSAPHLRSGTPPKNPRRDTAKPATASAPTTGTSTSDTGTVATGDRDTSGANSSTGASPDAGTTATQPNAEPSGSRSDAAATDLPRPSVPDLGDTQPLAPEDLPTSGFGLASAPTGRRVRARLARFNAPWQTTQVSEVLEPLIATHRASHPKADGRALQRAFDVAARWHSGQYRKSGDPYITHPLAVATILANLGMDTTTLVAALLHDTIEDTGYGLEQMRADFGGEVALLVDGVTKLDRVKLGDAAKAETIRKMVVAMAKDPRVLVIKLADRLHNMRTLTFLPRAKQEQKAKETLEILAPLAHRLGMNTIKWELEDLAFGTLFPKRFEEINRLIGEHQPQREALLRQVTQKVQVDLKAAKIKAETTGRPKHLYSIYQKMIVRGRDFNDIYDLVGVRILVDTVRDCYAALGVIHAN
ncbi:MAG TPA: HD domain-containing protein, partial [Actinoplanes sp.]